MLAQWKNKESIYKHDYACLYLFVNYETQMVKFGVTIRDITERMRYAKKGHRIYKLLDVRFGDKETITQAEKILKKNNGQGEYGHFLRIKDLYDKVTDDFKLQRTVFYSDMIK